MKAEEVSGKRSRAHKPGEEPALRDLTTLADPGAVVSGAPLIGVPLRMRAPDVLGLPPVLSAVWPMVAG